MKITHIAVVSKSQENSDRFYEGILGLKKMKTSYLKKDIIEQIFSVADDCQVIFYANQDIAIEVFIPVSISETVSSFGHLCLEVDDREQFLENCQKKGIEIRRIPKGPSLVIFIKDYDGNLFEIKESSE